MLDLVIGEIRDPRAPRQLVAGSGDDQMIDGADRRDRAVDRGPIDMFMTIGWALPATTFAASSPLSSPPPQTLLPSDQDRIRLSSAA